MEISHVYLKENHTVLVFVAVFFLLDQSIIYLFLCNNYPKTYWPKTTKVYHSIVSVGQKFKNGLAGCVPLRLSHEVTGKDMHYSDLKA